MAKTDSLPSRIAGTELVSSLPLGILGEGYLGSDSIVKMLSPGDAFSAVPDTPGLISFEVAGEEEGRIAIRAAREAMTPVGILVSGSALQNRALVAASLLDPQQALSRKLRALDSAQRLKLLSRLARDLARLHATGNAHPFLTPWTVVLTDSDLKLIDGGISPAPEFLDTVHVDALIYLAPELRRALASKVAPAADPAADVFAFAATARSMLLNQLTTHDSPGRNDPAEVMTGALPRLEAHDRYSSGIDALFARCLAADPSQRPTSEVVARELEELLVGGVSHVPIADWTTMGATAMAIVFLITLLLTTFRPLSQVERAAIAFAQATREADPEARDASLEEHAWSHQGDRQILIPAARRLKAIDAFLRWQKRPDPAELEGVLASLEEHVCAEDGSSAQPVDDLAMTARFLVGFLRRWELADEENRQHGDHLLAQATTPELSGLASAAQALTATGGRPVELDPSWLRSAQAAGAEGGALRRPYLISPAGLPRGTRGPAPISLDAAWIADLIAGRLLALQGRFDEGLPKLEAAEEAIGAFSTVAGLGLAIAERGGEPKRAVELLEAAQGYRQTAELQLAVAECTLAEAHRRGSAEAYATAAEAYRAISGASLDSPGDPERYVAAAAAGVMEATFYGAIVAASVPARLEEAQRTLTALLTTYKGNASFWARYGPDTRVALGLCLVELGRGARAKRDLMCMFEGRELRAGWATLPSLTPVPLTRDRRAVVSALLINLLADLGDIPRLVREDPAEAKATLREVGPDLSALLDLREASRLDAFSSSLARSELALAKALVLRSAETFERARERLLALRRGLDPRKRPAEFLQVSERLLDYYRARIAMVKTPAAKLPLRISAAEDLRVLDAAPAIVKSGSEQLRLDLAEVAGDTLRADLAAYFAVREPVWDAIHVESAREYRGPVAAEVRVLRHAITYAAPADAAAREALGGLHLRLATLLWSKRDAAFFDEATRGLEVALPLAAEGSALRRDLGYLLGYACAREPSLVKGKVKAAGADSILGFTRDALSTACGAKDFRALWAEAKAGSFEATEGSERAAALLVTTLASQVARSVPAAIDPGDVLPKAAEHAKTLRVGLVIYPGHAPARLLLAQVEFSRARGDPAKLEAVAEGALQAMKAAEEVPGWRSTHVRSARLACWARALSGLKDLASPSFRSIAAAGARSAQRLFRERPAERAKGYNHGPSYWLARSLLADAIPDGDKEAAIKAFDAFADSLGEVEPPPEAKAWKRERATLEQGTAPKPR